MDKRNGFGPDDMGDDAQQTEVAEYAQYIEDPPEDMLIAEDDDNDAAQAMDWAARHPRSASAAASPDDRPAEESAVHETRGKLGEEDNLSSERSGPALRAPNTAH